MKPLSEKFDSFGIPGLIEDRVSHIRSEDARNNLERAKDEIRRALDCLREVQKKVEASEKAGSEVRSAILAAIECEKTLITAIQRTENVIHRVRKSQIKSESVSGGEEIEVDFDHGGKKLVALFNVSGALESDYQGGHDWVKIPEIHLLGISEKDEPEKEVLPSSIDHKLIEKLEDEALEKFAEWYVDYVLRAPR